MNTRDYVRILRRAADQIRRKSGGLQPRIGVILGSGLGAAVPDLHGARVIPYASIPGFPRTTVSGHSGRLVVGRLGGASGLPVAVLQGRFHYYEGHGMEAITLPIRALESLGMKSLVITSAVGSMNPAFKPGHIVAISDHINFMGTNPLRGFHTEEFGQMFSDLSDAYSPKLRKLAVAACRKLKIPAGQGVYAAVGGPSYETPAEIRAFRRLGGDVVGMSVVPEVIVARQMGVSVLALAWVANMAAGLSRQALSHPEVLALGKQMSLRLRGLLELVLREV